MRRGGEELANDGAQMASTNSSLVVQLNAGGGKQQDRTLNLNVQKVKDIAGFERICARICVSCAASKPGTPTVCGKGYKQELLEKMHN